MTPERLEEIRLRVALCQGGKRSWNYMREMLAHVDLLSAQLEEARASEGYGRMWREVQAAQAEAASLRYGVKVLWKAMRRYSHPMAGDCCRCLACAALRETEGLVKP